MPNPAESFEEWAERQPECTKRDPIWRMASYRLACYLLAQSWPDALLLSQHPATRRIAGQLYEAVGSIAANIADGFGRRSPRDRMRFYEYALCSSRESLVWYNAGQPLLGEGLVATRVATLHRVIPLLLATFRNERRTEDAGARR